MKQRGKLSENRVWVLKGYLAMLRDAPPNGRTAHDLAQKMTVLKMCLDGGLELPAGCEAEIKGIIKELYDERTYKSYPQEDIDRY